MKDWTARKIRQLRLDAGMTQRAFADWLGVTRVHVSHLESDIRPAGPQTVRLLDLLVEKLAKGELKLVQPTRKGGRK